MTKAEAIEYAFINAHDAFWGEVARAFPEAADGHAFPEQQIQWDAWMNIMIEEWVANNVPEEAFDETD